MNRPTSDLRPHPQNPRVHTPAQRTQLRESIERFGWTVPIIVDEHLTILAGHGRHEVATELGMELVPTIQVTGLSEDSKRAYVILDNRLSENAQWDFDLLSSEINALGELGFTHEQLGFTDEAMLGVDSMAGMGEDLMWQPPPQYERPERRDSTGQAIESGTEPTALQDNGYTSPRETLDHSADGGNPFAETQQPPNTAEAEQDAGATPDRWPPDLMQFQIDRVLAILSVVKRVEEVSSDADALVLMAELYAETNGEPEYVEEGEPGVTENE